MYHPILLCFVPPGYSGMFTCMGFKYLKMHKPQARTWNNGSEVGKGSGACGAARVP